MGYYADSHAEQTLHMGWERTPVYEARKVQSLYHEIVRETPKAYLVLLKSRITGKVDSKPMWFPKWCTEVSDILYNGAPEKLIVSLPKYFKKESTPTQGQCNERRWG